MRLSSGRQDGQGCRPPRPRDLGCRTSMPRGSKGEHRRGRGTRHMFVDELQQRQQTRSADAGAQLRELYTIHSSVRLPLNCGVDLPFI